MFRTNRLHVSGPSRTVRAVDPSAWQPVADREDADGWLPHGTGADRRLPHQEGADGRLPRGTGAGRRLPHGRGVPGPLRTGYMLARAGFHRYATYRQAALASTFTNVVFGLLRCSVITAAAAGGGGMAAGYHRAQLVTFVFIGQGMIGTIALWGDTELSDRIARGDVIADLLRPVHPVLTLLATDLGRAGFAVLTRFVVPIAVGAVAFGLYRPHRWSTPPLFALSLLLAVVLAFACRYLVNATAYWLLDARGAHLAWSIASTVLCGLAFPLWFLPRGVVAVLWVATPFPSLMQATLDVAVERGSAPLAAGMVAGQAAWAAAGLAACAYVQHLAERRLVVQGG